VTLSSTSISVSQGGTSAPVTVSVIAQNGFTGNVQVSLSGLPSGMVSNPSGSFTVASGSTGTIVLGASSNEATGSSNLSVQGTSGSLSHSASLSVNVQAATASTLPRTTYARTDSIAYMDAPYSELYHRHAAYDSANKHVFIANSAANCVEVYSTTNQTRVAEISVQGASSVDLSSDGTTVWVGTLTQSVAAIDTSALAVKARYTVPVNTSLPGNQADIPEEVVPLNTGNAFLRLREDYGPADELELWTPATNTWTDLTASVSELEHSGVGAMARSGDWSKVLVSANDSTGTVVVFQSNGTILANPVTVGTGTIPAVAANLDGSVFAVSASGGTQLFLLNGSLSVIAGPVAINAQSLVFSRDGSFLYASQTSASVPAISIFNGQNLQVVGQVPDVSIEGVHSQIQDVDETQLIFGLSNRGVSFIDAADPAAPAQPAPAFAAAPVAQPAEGSFAGGTSTALSGQNFSSTAQVKFGAQLSSTATVSGTGQIQTSSPPSVVNGAVNLSAYFSNNWLAIAPDAFSYGPQVREVLPNVGKTAGGDVVQIYGYGFGTAAGNITVTIGGASATVQQVANMPSLGTSLGLDSTYPFSLESITIQTPPGGAGKADIVVTSPSGTTTASKAFQYLQTDQVYTKAALYKFILYDQQRQWLYLSNTAGVDIFDLNTSQFQATGLTPSGGPPPNAGLRGLALTPDFSQLAVADFGAQNVYLFDPDTGAGTTVAVGGVGGYPDSGPARVAATSTQKIFVSMSIEQPNTTAIGCGCISQIDLSVSPPTVGAGPTVHLNGLTIPYISADALGDTVFLAYASIPGGPLASWQATGLNEFVPSPVSNSVTTDLAVAADGTTVATGTGANSYLYASALNLTGTPKVAEIEQIPNMNYVPGMAVHPSGALLYQPFLTGPAPAAPPATGIQGGINIIDTRTGQLRLRVMLPEPFAMLSTDIDARHGGFMALDENGQRIFALTTSGLTVVELNNVPLGIGTLSPTSGPAAGGTTVTIRGSGFVSGVTVTIGGKSATVTFKDMNTLSVVTPAVTAGPQQIVIANPDGESVSLDAAFTAN
jgi:hypothetical protein